MQIKIAEKIIKIFKNYKTHLLYSLALILWVLITLIAPEMNNFTSDEGWYYVIAKDLNLIEIIKLMKYEGHNFLYYLLMKPFTHDLSLYPSILKYYSWFFSFIAIILFCLFSKVNMIIKFLIMFSYPFLIAFPTLGKPYGLGVLFLFLLSILYKNRLKYPVIYAFIIFLTANIHVFVTFGAITISFIFLYDLIKNRSSYTPKILYWSIFIILFTYLLLIIQWFPVQMPNYVSIYNKNECIYSFFYLNNNTIIKNFLWIMYIPITIIIFVLNIIAIKSKRWLFFIVFVYSLLSMFFKFVYPLIPPYGYFYYVYLIITYMMLVENNVDFKIKKYAITSMSLYVIIFSLILFPFNREYYTSQPKYEEYKKEIADIAKIIPVGSTVYLAYAQELMPFLVANYKVKTCLGYDIPSYRAYSGLYQDKILRPSQVKTVDGEKSYYIYWKKKFYYSKDKIYKKYRLGNNNSYEIVDLNINK